MDDILYENYTEYENERWVHYTNHELLTINPKQFHQDPYGIYFFPESHIPKATLWYQKKYKYIVTLKLNSRVLDLPKISDNDLNKIIIEMGVKDKFEDYIKQYPPKNRKNMIDMAWEKMRTDGGYRYGYWNKAIRNLGYDAVFDDEGIIHPSEPIQLFVVNPRCINIVDREIIKSDYFRKMMMVFDDLKTLAEEYGNVTTEPPRIVSRYGIKTLQAYIRINDYDTKPYATISISRNNDKNWRHMVSVSVSSYPNLRSSLGGNYDTFKNSWEDGYGDKTVLDRIKDGLDKVFSSDENTPRDNYGAI